MKINANEMQEDISAQKEQILGLKFADSMRKSPWNHIVLEKFIS